ncbi:MAG: hypothetical protein ABI583_09550 [Betaproteobacteria bacterium]
MPPWTGVCGTLKPPGDIGPGAQTTVTDTPNCPAALLLPQVPELEAGEGFTVTLNCPCSRAALAAFAQSASTPNIRQPLMALTLLRNIVFDLWLVFNEAQAKLAVA